MNRDRVWRGHHEITGLHEHRGRCEAVSLDPAYCRDEEVADPFDRTNEQFPLLAPPTLNGRLVGPVLLVEAPDSFRSCPAQKDVPFPSKLKLLREPKLLSSILFERPVRAWSMATFWALRDSRPVEPYPAEHILGLLPAAAPLPAWVAHVRMADADLRPASWEEVPAGNSWHLLPTLRLRLGQGLGPEAASLERCKIW